MPPADDRQPVVAVEDLTREYRRGAEVVVAVSRVTLAIDPGTFVAVVGPSGSGKSTLLHLIGGLDRPTRGRVLFDGRDLARMSERDVTLLRRRHIGFVFQFFNLLPNLPAWQNMALPLLIDDVAPEAAHERARALARRLGIQNRLSAPAGLLSGGEMQRVALGRALITHPPLVLADEPTGNLDSTNGREVLRLVKELVCELGSSVVMVTHDQAAAAVADRVVSIADGRVVGGDR